jgi:hypothetical protein
MVEELGEVDERELVHRPDEREVRHYEVDDGAL